MQFIINEKILSIPPYISTSWENVTSLHIENESSIQVLAITLKNGNLIKLPHMPEEVLTKVFQKHSEYVQTQSAPKTTNPFEGLMNNENFLKMGGNNIPIQMGIGLDGIGAAMQHDPKSANAPDIPKEIIEKITAVSKIMGGDQLADNMKAEPHCNCTYCQIARAINGVTKEETSKEQLEEEVTDEDLKFKTWDIEQSGDKLYTVTNPLDNKEQYSVYLGEPLGCTCGQKNCEHIKAVLNT